jgi:hypothetical protein
MLGLILLLLSVCPLLNNYSENQANQAKFNGVIQSSGSGLQLYDKDTKIGSGCVLCKPLFTCPQGLKAGALLKNQAKHVTNVTYDAKGNSLKFSFHLKCKLKLYF